MLSFSSTVKIYIATQYVDFRSGIDALSCICRNSFKMDPMDGSVFVFINHSGTSLKILSYDGQGFWLSTKRLSAGKFKHYPKLPAKSLLGCIAEQVYVLFRGGDPAEVSGLPEWRKINVLD